MIFQVCQKLPLNKFMKLALQKNRAIEYLEFPTIFCPQNHKSVVGEGGHFPVLYYCPEISPGKEALISCYGDVSMFF